MFSFGSCKVRTHFSKIFSYFPLGEFEIWIFVPFCSLWYVIKVHFHRKEYQILSLCLQKVIGSEMTDLFGVSVLLTDSVVSFHNSFHDSFFDDFCCRLITFANSLDPDQDGQNVGPDLDPSRLTLAEFFEKLILKKEHEKLPSMQRVNLQLTTVTLFIFVASSSQPRVTVTWYCLQLLSKI